MTTIANMLAVNAGESRIRAFDVGRDLKPVADLVEQCFAENLDPDGRRYLRQMRMAAGNPRYLRWARIAAERASLPLSGFVWEEDDQLVGNLTLIPYLTTRQRYYLIANVAVHPDFRRRGIAARLTFRAVQHARTRRAQAVWLHVREGNYGAIELYQSLGFAEQARRSTWLWQGEPKDWSASTENALSKLGQETAINLKLSTRLGKHWGKQSHWIERLYPADIRWHIPFKKMALRPGVLGWLYRLFNDMYIKQWSVSAGGRLLGVVTWQAYSSSYADLLWVATSEREEDYIVGPLLRFAQRHVPHRRPLLLDYPANRAVEAIRSTGFSLHQTLIWMKIDLLQEN